jgi:ribosomal protein L14
MNEPAQGLKFGITVILAAVAAAVVTVLFSLGTSVNRAHEEDLRHELELREYRQFARYDGKTVTTADVIGVIISCRGNPQVQVIFKDGSGFTWTAAQRENEETFYSQTALSEALPLAAKYRCEAVKDANGVLTLIKFAEI